MWLNATSKAAFRGFVTSFANRGRPIFTISMLSFFNNQRGRMVNDSLGVGMHFCDYNPRIEFRDNMLLVLLGRALSLTT